AKWAIVRVVLGLIVFGAMFGAQHDMTSLTLQAGFSAALLLLLVGDAGKARIGAGAGLSVAYLLLATAGVMQTWTGSNPAAAALLTSKGDISPAAGRLKGEKFDYCLSVPEQHWYLRAPQLASRDNPSSDRWLTRPDLDAHVMIMGEAVEPTLRINQDKFERAVIDEMKGRLTKFENLGREPLPGGAMLHLRGHAKTLDLEYYRGLFAYGNRGYQVVAFATPKSFALACRRGARGRPWPGTWCSPCALRARRSPAPGRPSPPSPPRQPPRSRARARSAAAGGRGRAGSNVRCPSLRAARPAATDRSTLPAARARGPSPGWCRCARRATARAGRDVC